VGPSPYIWFTTVDSEVFLGVFFNVKFELLNFLQIHKVEMDWVSIGGQIDKVEIISLTYFIRGIHALHLTLNGIFHHLRHH
jgi:hypothetical protein